MQSIIILLVTLITVACVATKSTQDVKIMPLYAMPPNEQINILQNRFGVAFENRYNHLPTEGKVNTPWAGSYWPTYMDSINKDWEGKGLSPAAKYAKSLNLNVRQIEDDVSRSNGIEGQSGNTHCKNDTQCKDGEVCSMRRGKDKGYCIASWYGLCHGWAPAAYIEKEPMCPVVHNGIKFEVNDIKALLVYLYANTHLDKAYAGARCNADKIDTDKHGRPTVNECLDINAGTFHLIVTNMIGRAKRTFIADITLGSEVWNHPIASYKLSSPVIMSPAHAMKKFFKNDEYIFNPAALQIVHYRMTVKYTIESSETDNTSFTKTNTLDQYLNQITYDYILEINSAGHILGGEFVNDSKLDHFDFIWAVINPINPRASASGIHYAVVADLLAQSVRNTC